MEFRAQAEGLALRGSRNVSSLVPGGKAEVHVVTGGLMVGGGRRGSDDGLLPLSVDLR